MLWTALEDPDPVIIMEHATLYNDEAELPVDGDFALNIDRAAIRRSGSDATIVAYSANVKKALTAADQLASEGIDCEVIDLRTLRPLDDSAIVASVARTHRAVVVDEGWRSGSLAAEVSSRIQEQAFYELDAPVERVCTAEVPIPYPRHLEEAAIPQPETIAAAVRKALRK
jgi:pyruvate dehydrogenase E1 component beta subunit